MCPTCAVFARGPFEPTVVGSSDAPPAENGKAEQEEDANKGKNPATRALSLKKKEEEEEDDDDDDDDDDVDYSPDTKRRKPKTPPARKGGNVRKKAPDTIRRKPKTPPAESSRNEEEGSGAKARLAGHGKYKCRKYEAPATTARGTRTVPTPDHVPEDVRKQRCCVTCYRYWRFLHEPRALA